MTFYHYPDANTELVYSVTYRITGSYVPGKYCLSNGDVGYEDEYPELEIDRIELDGVDVYDGISAELFREIMDECWKEFEKKNN